jgi:hypothetical protein
MGFVILKWAKARACLHILSLVCMLQKFLLGYGRAQQIVVNDKVETGPHKT